MVRFFLKSVQFSRESPLSTYILLWKFVIQVVKRQETLLKFKNGVIPEIDFSKWDLQT